MRTASKINETDLPDRTLTLYRLIQKKTGGNTARFAKKIGTTQQSVQRLFHKDPRTGSYPSVSDRIEGMVSIAFGLPSGWLPRAQRTAGVAGSVVNPTSTLPAESLIGFLPEYDFARKVISDAMSPKYNIGDVVVFKEIQDYMALQWGEVYLLSTTSGYIFGRLYPDGDLFRCEFDNKKMQERKVKRSDVTSIAMALCLIRAVI